MFFRVRTISKTLLDANMKHDGGWKLNTSRFIFDSPWFSLRQDELTLPNGEDITYTVVDHAGYAVVVPLLDDGRLVMEHVFRHPVQKTLLECPMGGLDGNTPEQAAMRELEEETGYRAKSWKKLGQFYGSSGISNELFYVFLATDLTKDGEINLEATEQLETELIPLQTLLKKIHAGEIESGPSSLAVLLAADHLTESF